MNIGGLGEWVAVERYEAPKQHKGLYLAAGTQSNAFRVLHVGNKVNISISDNDIVFVADLTRLYKASYGVDECLLAHQDNLIGYLIE